MARLSDNLLGLTRSKPFLSYSKKRADDNQALLHKNELPLLDLLVRLLNISALSNRLIEAPEPL
eukprot:12914123-Prorocentrum_lima.AAC.1